MLDPLQMVPWTDFSRLRCNNASLVHAITAHFEADRQLTSGMGLNKVQIGNGRTPTVFTPWASQLEATAFVSESGSYSQPTYSHGGGDSLPSFTFSPEQMDYRQASVSVPESTPSTLPLLYDSVTLGPIIDCSGVADLILEKVSPPLLKEKEKKTTSSTRLNLPTTVTGNLTSISSKLPLHTFGTLKHASVATDCLLQFGKDDQVKKSDFVNWEFSERVRFEQSRNQEVDHCANKESKPKAEQRKIAAMHEGYLKNYRKDRHPSVVTLQKSDHMRRERDRRIALKLMYKTLDSMIPKPSKKSKRDRTAIVDDALKYVKGMQEKLERLRVNGVHKSSSSTNRLLKTGHENLIASSTDELPSTSCSGQVTAATAPEQGKSTPGITPDQECLGTDSLVVLDPKIDVFIGTGCGEDVLINISCRPRTHLVSCVLEALEILCLEVKQYTFSKLLEELVHCNFMTKQKEASGDTPTVQMIEDVLKSLLK